MAWLVTAVRNFPSLDWNFQSFSAADVIASFQMCTPLVRFLGLSPHPTSSTFYHKANSYFLVSCSPTLLSNGGSTLWFVNIISMLCVLHPIHIPWKIPVLMVKSPYHGFVEDDCVFSQWEIPYDWGIYREYLLLFGVFQISKSKMYHDVYIYIYI